MYDVLYPSYCCQVGIRSIRLLLHHHSSSTEITQRDDEVPSEVQQIGWEWSEVGHWRLCGSTEGINIITTAGNLLLLH